MVTKTKPKDPPAAAPTGLISDSDRREMLIDWIKANDKYFFCKPVHSGRGRRRIADQNERHRTRGTRGKTRQILAQTEAEKGISRPRVRGNSGQGLGTR